MVTSLVASRLLSELVGERSADSTDTQCPGTSVNSVIIHHSTVQRCVTLR